ncbi:hypothetical protein ONR07_23950, partial [Salmonella enterica subsp. enterica serovar Anatum]|nr:hypothetical protein [Salmonella enterica subsp. enterica serovar Anatum]
DETPPPAAMTLAQWTRPATFRSLLAAYSDHIYRHTPGLPREKHLLKQDDATRSIVFVRKRERVHELAETLRLAGINNCYLEGEM